MAFSLSDFSDITELRRGGMGRLYRATQTSLDRPVVIKEMSQGENCEPDWNRRFENEARAAAALEHDNIIRIYDYGVDNGAFYIAMEYVEGRDLEELLHNPGFPRDIGLMIVLQALKGLHYSHRQGIVHRDVKPANVLVSKTGRVKVADFGLAFAATQSSRFTRTGAMVGTPHYMAPEQLNQDPRRDARVDVWAAGVVLYRVITGKLPFEGDTLPMIAYNIVHTKERDISLYARKLPKKLIRTIEKCLEKDREKRPDSLKPLIDALQEMFFSRGVKDPAEAIAACIASLYPEGKPDSSGRVLTTAEPVEENGIDVAAFEQKEARRRIWVTAAVLLAVFALAGALYLGTARFRSAAKPVLPQLETEATQPPEPADDTLLAEKPSGKRPAKPAAKPRRVYSATLHTGAPVSAPKPVYKKEDASVPAKVSAAPKDTAPVKPEAVVPDTVRSQAKQAAMPKPAGMGGLSVMSFPRASVYVDGKLIGKTPIETPVDVSVGKHAVAIVENGYGRKEMTVEIKKDKVERIKVKLEKN